GARWWHEVAGGNPVCRAKGARAGAAPAAARPAFAAGSLEINFRNDPSILDGRFANNGWLQELPKPITRLTWDNAVLVSPATAARLKASAQPAFRGGEHGQIISHLAELPYPRAS